MNKELFTKRLFHIGAGFTVIFFLCVAVTSMFNIGGWQWITVPLGFVSFVGMIWMLVWFLAEYLGINSDKTLY